MSTNAIDVDELTAGLPMIVPAKAAAEFLGITSRTLRRWIAEQKIQAFKLDPGRPGRVLVPREEIRRVLDESRL